MVFMEDISRGEVPNWQLWGEQSSAINSYLWEQLDELRAAHGDGNQGALYEAVKICVGWNVFIPEWLGHEVLEILESVDFGKPLKKKGRHSRWILKHQQDMIDLERAHTVLSCRENGIAGLDVYDVTSMLLKGTFAEGSEDTIKKSYHRYTRRVKDAPGRYHVLPSVRIHKKDKMFRQRQYMSQNQSTKEFFSPEDWETIKTYRITK